MEVWSLKDPTLYLQMASKVTNSIFFRSMEVGISTEKLELGNCGKSHKLLELCTLCRFGNAKRR